MSHAQGLDAADDSVRTCEIKNGAAEADLLISKVTARVTPPHTHTLFRVTARVTPPPHPHPFQKSPALTLSLQSE